MIEDRKPGRPSKRATTASARLQLRITPDCKARWRAAAAAQGLTLSEWITRQCDRATDGG